MNVTTFIRGISNSPIKFNRIVFYNRFLSDPICDTSKDIIPLGILTSEVYSYFYNSLKQEYLIKIRPRA